MSPAVAVSPVAIIATWHKLLSWTPYFAKFRWHGIEPEFDPFKYNSFPKNAGDQIFRLTRALHADLETQSTRDGLRALPPILAFQSVDDSTVVARAVVDRLYGKLPRNGSELVLFDINRASRLEPFIRAGHNALLHAVRKTAPHAYRLTIVTNAHPEGLAVVARTREPGSETFEERPLDLAWPPEIYSLSHVAIPFPPDDPVYGVGDRGGLFLGGVQPRGERGLLRLSLGQLMRLRFNPFHAYLEARLLESLDTSGAAW